MIRPEISIIITTRNEADTIRGLFNSLQAQTVQPKQIIVCDAGSSDGTADIITSYADTLPITIIHKTSASIAAGRNEAIRHAKTDRIAVSDAGCTLHSDWLEMLVQAFTDNPDAEVISGWYIPTGQNVKEQAFATLHALDPKKVDSETFLPSSRSVAFTKQAWEKVGGYPEWLTFAAEDTLFGSALKHSGCKFVFQPKAIVEWRMRPNLRSLFRQYYRYGFGDAEIKHLRKLFYLKSLLVGLLLLVLMLQPALMLIMTLAALLFFAVVKSRNPRLWPWIAVGKGMTFLGQYVGYGAGTLFGKKPQ